jgi:hypothetical protein
VACLSQINSDFKMHINFERFLKENMSIPYERNVRTHSSVILGSFYAHMILYFFLINKNMREKSNCSIFFFFFKKKGAMST